VRSLRIQDIRIAVGGRWLDSPPTGSGIVGGITTDTRNLKPGDLYVALKGENHDGHSFLAIARQMGAACAIVEQGTELHPAAKGLACIAVPDTLVAYGELASWHVRQHSLSRTLAIAGSNGKTTTRTLTHAVLSKGGDTLQNDANENNLVGVPKTMLGITPNHRFASIEIGTNQPGEISRLAAILRPDTAILTNIAEEHLEGLGGINGVLEEEAAVITALPPEGVAIMNGDDPYSMSLRPRAKCDVVAFGFSPRCHVRATQWTTASGGSTFVVNGLHQFKLPLPGRHNTMNALAAIAAGWVCGIPVESMQSALASIKPAKMRSELKDIGGVSVLNDCYNANPGSMVAALDALDGLPQRRHRIVCLGDMLEMGEHAESVHLGLADAVERAKPDLLVLVGPHMRTLGRVMEARGVTVWQFENSQHAGDAVAAEVRLGDLVLVKGSRGMKMERVTEALMARAEADALQTHAKAA